MKTERTYTPNICEINHSFLTPALDGNQSISSHCRFTLGEETFGNCWLQYCV